MNKVILVGRLGADPEAKQTTSGFVCRFSLATSEKRGEKDYTEWHRVVAFGKLAENCGKFLKKGSEALVDGRVQTRSWEKDGEKMFSTEIIAQTVKFLSKKVTEDSWT